MTVMAWGAGMVGVPKKQPGVGRGQLTLVPPPVEDFEGKYEQSNAAFCMHPEILIICD